MAAPVSWHKKMMMNCLEGATATHLLVLTRTAHMGLLFAGADLGLTTIAYVEGQSEHSMKHGESILKAMCVHKVLPSVRKSLQGDADGNNFVHLHGVQFIEGDVPSLDKQVVQLRDVEEASTSSWRAGINKIPNDLEKKVAELSVQDIMGYPNICLEEARPSHYFLLLKWKT